MITKIIMQKHDIPTPKFWVFSSVDEDMANVEFPVIVKPKMESVSFGLKVVHNTGDLKEAVGFIIQEFDQQALVEQFIRGREFAVGIIGNNPLEAFPVLEIDLENNPDAIQTDMDKRQKPRNKICPANISEELAYEMTDLSKKAFRALQLRDFARVDIRLDENNNIYLLEINSMASLGANGSYVFAASKAGYDFKALVNKMLDVAAVRYFTDYSWSVEEGTGKSPKMPLHVRMRGFLRGRQENIENLLRDMVNTNSYVRNVEGVNELGNMMKKQLSGLGFSHQVMSQLEVGNLLFFTNTVNEDYDILIIGNLDNTKKLSQHQYFQATELKLSGTGIWEHKGGLAVMIHALQALKYARLLKKTKIGILLTTDDSLQGKFAYPVVREKSLRAKYILGVHGASLNGGIVTSRSGAAYYRCQMNLMKSDNATDVAKATGIFSRLVYQWTELTKEDTGLIVAPRDIRLESNIREPFAHGEITLSVRFHEQPQFDEVDRKIKQLVPKKYKNLLHFQLEGGLRRVPMLKTEKVEELFSVIKSLSEKLDIRSREEHRWSSADICFVNNEKHVIDGMGPAGAKPTRASEYILRHSLLERSALLAMTLYELGKK